jgi:hypothetical protein
MPPRTGRSVDRMPHQHVTHTVPHLTVRDSKRKWDSVVLRNAFHEKRAKYVGQERVRGNSARTSVAHVAQTEEMACEKRVLDEIQDVLSDIRTKKRTVKSTKWRYVIPMQKVYQRDYTLSG